MSDEKKRPEPDLAYLIEEELAKDPLDAEIAIALERVMTDGDCEIEPDFYHNWEHTRPDIQKQLGDGQFTLALPRMYDMELDARDEGAELPKDFKELMERAFDQAYIVAYKAILHGNLELAYTYLTEFAKYDESEVIDHRVLDDLAGRYNEAVRKAYTFERGAFPGPEDEEETSADLDAYAAIEIEGMTPRAVTHGWDKMDVGGPELLRDMYEELLRTRE
ncbi:TPA: hypothetical protein HA265_00050 [Candidatus Woesearchaeota archaeon]|nr:hypothetical protein [Candidatus Woesearchaeota archaeon]